MIDYQLPASLMEWCHEFALANRVNTVTREPGSISQQLSGVIGQAGVTWLLGQSLMKSGAGFDGGYDISLPGTDSLPVFIDVKTMGRNVPVKDYMTNNFVDAQRRFKVDAYIFTSFNHMRNLLTICGWLTKQRAFQSGTFHKRGELRTRRDGTTFENRYDNWEIPVNKLYPATSILQLKDEIVRFSCYLREKVEA